MQQFSTSLLLLLALWTVCLVVSLSSIFTTDLVIVTTAMPQPEVTTSLSPIASCSSLLPTLSFQTIYKEGIHIHHRQILNHPPGNPPSTSFTSSTASSISTSSVTASPDFRGSPYGSIPHYNVTWSGTWPWSSFAWSSFTGKI